MPDRAELAARFLRRAGWDAASRQPLAGDASARVYVRLVATDGTRAVLMDAPPDAGQDVAPFLRIGAHLRRHGFSAPQVLAEDRKNGFLLLEDFGDGVFAWLVRDDPSQESRLYSAAIDMLLALSRVPPPGDMAPLTPAHLARMIEPVFDWYAPALGVPVAPAQRQAVQAALAAALGAALSNHTSLSLRDCHAENLIWLPDRTGVARVGLLDFQDAVVVHPAYDVVSLLQDARRDVPEDLRADMIARFAGGAGHDPEAFGAACAVLGVQRNLRILGIFARLALDQGKSRYLDLIPRVWGHVQRNLVHPALEPLAGPVRGAVPAPSDAALRRLAHDAA